MVERDSDKAIEHCKAAERQAGSKRKGLGTVSAKPNSCKAQGGNLATGAGGRFRVKAPSLWTLGEGLWKVTGCLAVRFWSAEPSAELVWTMSD